MGKRFAQLDLSRMGDDKALALASYGESVATYRYIILSEKAKDARLRQAFEVMAREEKDHRDRVQNLLREVSPSGGFYLGPDDKLAVCVGPRLVDARDDARMDEALKLIIASEKRTASFYSRYSEFAREPKVKALFTELAQEGLVRVRRLRELFQSAGREIMEPCPVAQIKMA